eukprot:g33388.t1
MDADFDVERCDVEHFSTRNMETDYDIKDTNLKGLQEERDLDTYGRQNCTQYSKSGLTNVLPLPNLIKVLLYSEITFFTVHYTTNFGVICK